MTIFVLTILSNCSEIGHCKYTPSGSPPKKNIAKILPILYPTIYKISSIEQNQCGTLQALWKFTSYIIVSKRIRNFNNACSLKTRNSITQHPDSAWNLGIVFNNDLSWSKHINVTVGKVHSMSRNVWAFKECIPLHIRLLLGKLYIVPTFLYECELYANCNTAATLKLNVVVINIARYILLKSAMIIYQHILLYFFNMDFENLLKFKTVIYLQKIVSTNEPDYLLERLNIISEKQFYLKVIRLMELFKYIEILMKIIYFVKLKIIVSQCKFSIPKQKKDCRNLCYEQHSWRSTLRRLMQGHAQTII